MKYLKTFNESILDNGDFLYKEISPDDYFSFDDDREVFMPSINILIFFKKTTLFPTFAHRKKISFLDL